MGDADLSPLMRQYRDIKRGYPDAILFFRVGDFYEMFYEDAVEGSALLAIALTSRDKHSEQPVPLCGVPYHAATGYIAKLLKAGRTVALCDQVENPKVAKGLVRREVVRLYTPGTLVDSEFLPPSQANYLVAVSTGSSASRRDVSMIGLAAIDVSTGTFFVQEFSDEGAESACLNELARIDPKELLVSAHISPGIKRQLDNVKTLRLSQSTTSWSGLQEAHRLLLDHFNVQSLDGFGCRSFSVGIECAAAVIRYLRESQPSSNLGHITRLEARHQQDAMHLDAATIHNLELVRAIHDREPTTGRQEGTLLSVLDRTVTSMGTRLLREWILRPLLNCRAIELRLDAVEELKERTDIRVGLRACLRAVQDISRLSKAGVIA